MNAQYCGMFQYELSERAIVRTIAKTPGNDCNQLSSFFQQQ